MQKKDYIVRQFEEFGKVMAAILGFKKENDWEKFEKEIAEAAQKFTLLEVSYVETLDAEGFEREVLRHPQLTLEQKKILADLLFEKLNFYLEKDDKERYLKLKDQCLLIYTHIHENFTENEFDLNVHYRLNFLNKISE